MPEKKSNSDSNKMPSNQCGCCPYGFHIDRDFVRYCDSLYNTAQLDKLRQHKRERRKEKKTVESYLGLGNICSSQYSEPNHTTVRQHNTLPNDFYLNSESLKDAVTDFEDTWQRSLKKSSSSFAVSEKRNGFKVSKDLATCETSAITCASMENKELYTTTFPAVQSRSSSMSSVSSTASILGPMPDASRISCMSDQMTAAIATLSKPISSSSNTVGIHRSVLTNIRAQMASSLHRMRELEEQVKSIPILEIKLSALKEEKNSLLNQLKLKESKLQNKKSVNSDGDLEKQLKRLENEGIMSPTLTKKCLLSRSHVDNLSSPVIASCIDAAMAKKSFLEKEIISHIKMCDINSGIEKCKNMKSVGTSCSVLTRDIGIGYVPNKSKSIGVGNEASFIYSLYSCNEKKYDQLTSISSESLESDSESVNGSFDHARLFLQQRNLKSLVVSPIKSDCPNVGLKDSSTSTDVIYLNKSVNTELLLPKFILNNSTFQNKSTLISPSVRTKAVQAVEKKAVRTIGLQISGSVNVDREVEKAFNQNQILKHSVAVGDFNILDTICALCLKAKTSVGVGDSDINISFCDRCRLVKTVSTSCGEASIYDVCDKCSIHQKENAAVGDFDVNDVSCEQCQNNSIQRNEMQSVGINTTIDSSSHLNLSSGIHICDKCSATIHSVAKDLATNTVDSKIPKLKLNIRSSDVPSETKRASFRTKFTKTQKHTSKSIHVSSSDDTEVESVVNRFDSEDLVSKGNDLNENKAKSADDTGSFSECSENLPNFLNLPVPPRKKTELNKEVRAACKVLNDYLLKPDRGGEKKTLSSLNIIQNEWFKVANQKNSDPHVIEDYLDAFEEFSKLLLERVVNLSDSNGNTALHYAVSYGNFDVVSILIDSKVCDVNKKNKAGYTSIMLVALADMRNDAHHYVVQRLFSIGDINIKATQNGQTALMLAVSHGKKEIVKMLLDVGAEVNLQDKDGSTALMCAAEHGHLEIVKLLLSHPECDPTIVDNDECNALTIAMEAGHKDIGLLIYTNMNFSRGSSPYSTLKNRKRSTPRSTPPPRTPTLRTPPLPSPSARSTNSIPASFHFPS
ncbi:KN motif and ankyrin repeat domain-containing protein 1-like [Stegodyphus dumicola]|uniref:KN motif and ankyrin repeat domain-containing protein 1-like n=1 Tax=Stegodyphus dumicola TaxID=202533 RepID=UPI0015A8DD1E|nr:KN motif and ankyrin repeat domain-containing protein 1-like [Stegodyphus dumicola]